MINSGAYDYINVLDKAADASWIRNDVIANNIANVDTPGYKRQDVDFEGELQKALGNSKYTTMDDKVKALDTKDLTPRTYTDSANFSYRLDGNNVDIDTENVTLAANELKYNGIMTAMQTEFSNLKSAMSGS
ncbi:MAG: flagellar basal body rod protein FlgB [Butyrivibrio sp.]|jgi:flagellar basal-body rod protein FlgB|nr:flagellar basal body rod protein FlgB [Butyrivibrio sp.]